MIAEKSEPELIAMMEHYPEVMEGIAGSETLLIAGLPEMMEEAPEYHPEPGPEPVPVIMEEAPELNPGPRPEPVAENIPGMYQEAPEYGQEGNGYPQEASLYGPSNGPSYEPEAPSYGTEIRCEKQCNHGYYLHPNFCECFLICDYVMECDYGFEWNFIECGCVVRLKKIEDDT